MNPITQQDELRTIKDEIEDTYRECARLRSSLDGALQFDNDRAVGIFKLFFTQFSHLITCSQNEPKVKGYVPKPSENGDNGLIQSILTWREQPHVVIIRGRQTIPKNTIREGMRMFDQYQEILWHVGLVAIRG